MCSAVNHVCSWCVCVLLLILFILAMVRLSMSVCVYPYKYTNVTCSHEMIDKSRHAVPRFSLKTVVGVNLGEIEIFALYRSSFIFAPYTCSFLLYSTHKCFKFCK